MTTVTAVLLVLLHATSVDGEAAFNYRIESAAQVRGIDLGTHPGCAVFDCNRIGDKAWVKIGPKWTGPYLVVDCTASHDQQFWIDNDRVVDLSWSTWEVHNLPLTPVPVKLSFGGIGALQIEETLELHPGISGNSRSSSINPDRADFGELWRDIDSDPYSRVIRDSMPSVP